MTILQYDIRVVGAANVDKALAGIEARIRQHNQRVAHAVGVTPAQARRASAPGSESAFRASASRHFQVVGKSKEKAERDASKIQEAAQKKSERAKEKALKEEHRIRNAINNVNLKALRDEDRLRDRTRAKDLRIAHARTRFLQSTVGRGFDRAANTVRTVGSAGAAMLGVGGAALAATAVSGATKLDETTRRLIVQGTGAGEKPKFEANALRKQFEQTGVETGIAPQDVAEGVAQFVTKVGDMDTAVKNMKVFATTSMATGAAVQDIASSAADLSEKLGVKDVADMSKALAILAFQGKKGAFELKDMAQYLPEVAAEAAKFGISGVAGVQSLGGLMQVARRATGSGAEASTSMQAMFRQLVAKSTDIQSGDAFGGRKVSVFQNNDPTKGARDVREIIGDVIAASRGNVQELNEVFDARGVRAVNPLITAFREASEKAGGGEKGATAGRAAVMAQIKDAADVKGDFSDLEKDAGEAMKSFNVQLGIINTRLKNEVAAELLPELIRLAPAVSELVPVVGRAAKVFVDLVKFMMEHPFQALAIVVATQLAADFAKAKLGDLVGRLITRAMGGGGKAPALPGGGSGTPTPGPGFLGRPAASGVMNAASAGAAVGLTVASAIFTVGVANFEIGEANMKRSGEVLNQIRAMGSPEDAAKARELVDQQRKTVNAASEGGVVSNIFGRGFAEFIGVEQAAELKTQQTILAEMEERLKKLDALSDIAVQMKTAGASQEEAARKLTEAAQRLGISPGPNRGNSPSPIKG